MTGTMMLHPLVKESLGRRLSRFYPAGMLDLERMEDLVLATPKRSEYADIGMGVLDQDALTYGLTNLAWINVCLFANSDFRECFYDAIMIEKALLQVSREEYAEFREDMELASKANSVPPKQVGVNFSVFDNTTEDAIGMYLEYGRDQLVSSGTMEAYGMLLQELDEPALERVKYAVYNLVYLINALQYNGVFRKYVTIVVDNVKQQLMPGPGQQAT